MNNLRTNDKANVRKLLCFYYPVPLLTCFFLVSANLFGQKQNETGMYNIRNYSAKEYNLVPQNFAVVQDARGVLYFGNNSGILEYDGHNWDTIMTQEELPIHSLTIDSKGVIYVGGTGEIGYLAPNNNGQMRYHSLLSYIREKQDKDFAEVWTCFATKDNYVYFQASTKIFRWDGKKMMVRYPNQGTTFHLMFYENGTLYVREKEVGLMKMVDSSLHFIQGGDLFSELKVYFMQPFRKNEILLNTEGRGLFTMLPADFSARIQDKGQLTRITPFHTEIDQFFAGNKVYNGIRLNEKNYSIGTLTGGVVVIDSSGKFVGAINKKNGLQDDGVNYQFLDSQEKLWLATNNGISKVDINSPVTTFNDQTGLEGRVLAITRNNGKLYAATLSGIFCLEGQDLSQGYVIGQAHFNKIDGITTECWDLLSFNTGKKHVLLVATNEGIIQIGDDNKPVPLGFLLNVNVLHKSIIDSNRVFIGCSISGTSTHGLVSMYWDNGKWIEEGSVGDLTENVTSIEEDKDGTIWCGHTKEGVIRIRPVYKNSKIDDATDVKKFDSAQGLPNESNIYVKSINGHIYFCTPKGLYKYDGNNKFACDKSLGSQFSNKDTGVFRIDQDREGNIWIITITNSDNNLHIGYIKNPGKPNQEVINKPFISLSKSIVQSFCFDDDGIAWLGGQDGVFRYDNKIQKNYNPVYNALVRKVIVSKGKDSTIFSGTYSDDSGHVSLDQPERLKLSLPFAFNSLTFYYAATDFEDESSTQYRYRLEGSDEQHSQWSDWKNETKAPYTFLHEGHYIFHVEARNVFKQESREAIYEFTILSPWYRTVWAYIAYVLGLIAFVYSAISISTRSLRNIISERTAEVVKQKEVIEMKNKDITDSINYAKRIQEAILPTRERFKSVLPQSFILFKPKDIVSGDFYWMSEKNDIIFVAAGDCTGHGVPGAMVSVVCSNALNRAVKEFGIIEPGRILDKVRDLVIETFEKSEKEDIKDGMDISLCTINTRTKEIQWSGANNPLWYIKDNEIKEITADKQPIGNSDNPRPFTTHTIKLDKGDEIYLFTDGYADQFGGPKGKKFKYKQLEEKVLEGRSLDMNMQRNNLNITFENWKGNLEQIDDVLIIGIRV
ncbi:MAG TPA: SpoIIE family protein phosphatase [Bacteroidia bacterium]|nr:SpoIIE family protein phosphatase [Bacteroidia bacterium]